MSILVIYSLPDKPDECNTVCTISNEDRCMTLSQFVEGYLNQPGDFSTMKIDKLFASLFVGSTRYIIRDWDKFTFDFDTKIVNLMFEYEEEDSGEDEGAPDI